MVVSPKGLGLEKGCAGKGSAACTNDRPVLSSERAPYKKQERNCKTVIYIWSCVPDGARHQDLLTEWPSVAV
jgi:hypothetical protein